MLLGATILDSVSLVEKLSVESHCMMDLEILEFEAG